MTGLACVLFGMIMISITWSIDSDEWVLVFKGVTGGSTSIYDLFLSNATFNSFVKESQVLNSTFKDHYKSDIINYWDAMNITKVKIGVYVGESQEAFFEFDAQGCKRSTWFSQTRLVNTSYTDLLQPSTPINFFSIEGHLNAEGPDLHKRRFFINSFYDSCDKDKGWFLVYDVGSRGFCSWETDYLNEVPAVLFSPHTTASLFAEDRLNLKADFVTISVQFGLNSFVTDTCLRPEVNYCCQDCLINEEETTQGSDTTTVTARPVTNMSVDQVTPVPTVLMDTLHDKVVQIKKELTVSKKETSAYMRTKSSAYDGRESSRSIGILGVAILVTIALLIIIPDTVVMFQTLYKMYLRRK